MEIPLLNDIVIIFGIAIAVLYLCHRLRVPAVVGFLLTGIVAGPFGMGLIKAVHEVEVIAEIGIVLLLFTIGVEFSFKRLLQIRKAVLAGGSLQVLLTFLATLWMARQMDVNLMQAIFAGFLVSLSSTVIVLKLLQERGDVDSPHGSTTLGILIFQDIIIVPMILVTPLLGEAPGDLSQALLLLLGKGLAIIVLVIVSAKWLVPGFLHQIAKTRNHELFRITVVVICFGVAWLTSEAGLSLALGAFLAGLIISESEYSHQALGNILPFRDVFTTFFFVSIGMMLDLGFLLRQPGMILLITLAVLLLKTGIAGGVTLLLGFPLRTGILVGVALAQIGEFSFILSRVGLENGLLTADTYQMFLAVSVLSMALTPFAIALAPRLADAVATLPLPDRLRLGVYPVTENQVESPKGHLVIIGFGVNGRNVAAAAKIAGIPYAIIEMNPETVRSERARGEPIYYGDSTQRIILQQANIAEARIAVVAVNDPTTTRRIAEVVRRSSPGVHLLVRTRYLQEMKPLYELGADEVIPEEFETSVEIFTRVLAKYLVPRDAIEKLVAEVRSDGYEMFRSLGRSSASLDDLTSHVQDLDISTFRVQAESVLANKSLAQIALRSRYGVSLVAIRREEALITDPGADTVLLVDDLLFVLGSSPKIAEAMKTLRPDRGS